MEYVIVSQRDADWRKFKALRLKALLTDQSAFGTSYTDEYKKSDSYWKEGLARAEKPLLFISMNGRYIAMVSAKPVEGTIAMITDLYVLDAYRRKGLAAMLVKMIESELQKAGMTDIDLVVNKERIRAIGLYRKLGYALVNEIEEPMGDGMMHPCLFMSKKIIS